MENLGRLNIQCKSIEDLTPADYNPREISDKARQGLSNSIDTFGLVEPIVWNKRSGVVVGGHQRLDQLIIKGVKETDVVVVDLSPAEEKALNVALNHQGIAGQYDQTKLANLLSEIKIDNQDAYIDLHFDELELPDWDDLPDVTGEHSLDESSVKIQLKIPKSKEYLKEEILEHIQTSIREHWPDNGIEVK